MIRGKYGELESNNIKEWLPGGVSSMHDFLQTMAPGSYYWNDPRIKRITRLRLLSDPGFPAWDVSYCYGELQDGTPCRVDLPFNQLDKYRVSISKQIVAYAKKDGVYAKGIGILDNVSKLI